MAGSVSAASGGGDPPPSLGLLMRSRPVRRRSAEPAPGEHSAKLQPPAEAAPAVVRIVLTPADTEALLALLRRFAASGKRPLDEADAIGKIDWALGLLLGRLPFGPGHVAPAVVDRWRRTALAADRLLDELYADRENWLGHFLNVNVYVSGLVRQVEELQSYLAGVAGQPQHARAPDRDAQIDFVRRLATFCRTGSLPMTATRAARRATPFAQLVRCCLRAAGLPLDDVDAVIAAGLARSARIDPDDAN